MKLTKSKLREIIREVIREMDFKNKESFRDYQSKHKMRPTTKISIAGKEQLLERQVNQEVDF